MTRIQSSSKSGQRAAGVLTRLRRDTAGNTIAMVGAFMVPLAALVGSGVDMSRSYLVKTRLQSAARSGLFA